MFIIIKSILNSATEPVAIIGLVGILYLFFKPRGKRTKEESRLFWLYIVLLFGAAWRIPTITDRRYALPLLIGVFVGCIIAFERIKRQRIQIRFACILLFSVVLFYLPIKAFHLPKIKYQLTAIPEIIQRDSENYNILLFQIGNPGGVMQFHNVTVVTLPETDILNAETLAKELRNIFDPGISRFFYRKVFLAVYGLEYSDFECFYDSKDCRKIFESNKKNKRYCLYELHDSQSPKFNTRDSIRALFSQNNILSNATFSTSREINNQTDFVKKLESFPKLSCFPDNWEISTLAKGKFNMKRDLKIDYDPKVAAFTMQSPALVSLWHNGEGISQGNYIGLFEATVPPQSRIALLKGYFSSSTGKYISGEWGYPITLSVSEDVFYLFSIKVAENHVMQPAVYLFFGTISLKQVSIIPESAVNL